MGHGLQKAKQEGGFGSVYKGSLGDGTLVAVKKLDRVLPHGKEEFITEVNTIGSMHHMNLVRLCGYCSEGSHRYALFLDNSIPGAEDYNDSTRRGTSTIVVDPGLLHSGISAHQRDSNVSMTDLVSAEDDVNLRVSTGLLGHD
ncbi:hypothetical protein JHK84_052641 [Glycine max]|nr:hypothetical protein JHK84_052641 [Glycine max]